MVTFITGKMNSGKTTRLIETYKEQGSGEGFALIKIMKDTKVHSYRARSLSTGEERLLILRDIWLSQGFDEVCRIGPYCFSGDTLSWIEVSLEQAVSDGISPLYLDELGVLELQGQGYAKILKVLIQSKLDLVLTTREDLLEKLVACYEIDDYRVIDV